MKTVFKNNVEKQRAEELRMRKEKQVKELKGTIKHFEIQVTDLDELKELYDKCMEDEDIRNKPSFSKVKKLWKAGKLKTHDAGYAGHIKCDRIKQEGKPDIKFHLYFHIFS